MKKLNITFCSTPDYSNNARALYEYMKDKYDFNYTWIVSKKENAEILKEKGIKVFQNDTQECNDYLKTTDVFFTTHANLLGNKTKNSIYVELWHGIGSKPQGYLCNEKYYKKEEIDYVKNINSSVDYLIVPNEFWKCIFSSIFNVDGFRIKTLGLPVLEEFINPEGKDNLKKLLNDDLKEYKKIIYYTPTYRRINNYNDVKAKKANNIFNFDKYDEEKFNEFLKKKKYLMCVKRHPEDPAKYTDKDNSNIRVINEDMLIKKDLTINSIMNACDLMICDYSSLLTEYVFLNRPIIHINTDVEEYINTRGIVFNNLDFWKVGPSPRNIKELENEMEKLLTDDSYYKDLREFKRDIWYHDVNNTPCKNICDYFFDNNKLRSNIKQHESYERYLLNKLKKEKFKNIELNDELNKIKNSKGWKTLEKMRKMKNRGK